jgi:hypothetical protein
VEPGDKRGRLTMLARCEAPKFARRGQKNEKWAMFHCECGKEKAFRITCVVNGGSRSCGCATRDTINRLNNAHVQESWAHRRRRARELRGGPR